MQCTACPLLDLQSHSSSKARQHLSRKFHQSSQKLFLVLQIFRKISLWESFTNLLKNKSRKFLNLPKNITSAPFQKASPIFSKIISSFTNLPKNIFVRKFYQSSQNIFHSLIFSKNIFVSTFPKSFMNPFKKYFTNLLKCLSLGSCVCCLAFLELGFRSLGLAGAALIFVSTFPESFTNPFSKIFRQYSQRFRFRFLGQRFWSLGLEGAAVIFVNTFPLHQSCICGVFKTKISKFRFSRCTSATAEDQNPGRSSLGSLARW